jgi:hypothetical protein
MLPLARAAGFHSDLPHKRLSPAVLAIPLDNVMLVTFSW